MFASRSAIASDNSPNAGSNLFRGNETLLSLAPLAESRKEPREDGRSGVVGRLREDGRLVADSWKVLDILKGQMKVLTGRGAIAFDFDRATTISKCKEVCDAVWLFGTPLSAYSSFCDVV